MLNCGLSDLRLVRPRPTWPHPRAVAAAAGADAVLDKARIFATAAEAMADLPYVYAPTARPREGVKAVVTARAAAAEARARLARGGRSGQPFAPARPGPQDEESAPAAAPPRVL